MPVIIKKGNVPKPVEWWAGISFTCPNCLTTARLDHTDRPNNHINGERAFIFCPLKDEGCDELIYLDKRKRIALDFRGEDITPK